MEDSEQPPLEYVLDGTPGQYDFSGVDFEYDTNSGRYSNIIGGSYGPVVDGYSQNEIYRVLDNVDSTILPEFFSIYIDTNSVDESGIYSTLMSSRDDSQSSTVLEAILMEYKGLSNIESSSNEQVYSPYETEYSMYNDPIFIIDPETIYEYIDRKGDYEMAVPDSKIVIIDPTDTVNMFAYGGIEGGVSYQNKDDAVDGTLEEQMKPDIISSPEMPKNNNIIDLLDQQKVAEDMKRIQEMKYRPAA